MTYATTYLLAKKLVVDMQAQLDPDVEVALGPAPTQAWPKRGIYVLCANPLDTSLAANGSSDMAWRTTGLSADLDQTGEFTVAIVCTDGGDDVTIPLDLGAELYEVIAAWARSSTGASVGIANITNALVSRDEWAVDTYDGSVLLLILTISYAAYLGG